MTSQYLISELAGANWLYTRPAFGRTGRGLAESNFAKERRDWLAILLREVLQNGLDARVSKDQPVEVRIKSFRPAPGDEALGQKLLPQLHLSRFDHSVLHQNDQTHDLQDFLIVEDFGTTGLIGKTDDPELEGKGQNWNAFWFREGEGGKENSSGNGGAGQGKITYFSTSGIRTIFAYTVRFDDTEGFLFGASSFKRDYEFEGHKWLRDAYWGITVQRGDGNIAVPSKDNSSIQHFCQVLGLTREPGQSGLSLVIPAARRFDLAHAVQITIAEFFAPIIRGDLIVQLGATRIDADSLLSLANDHLSDDRARELHTCTTRGYRDFYAQALERSRLNQVVHADAVSSASNMSESTFEPEVLEKLRLAITNEESITVRFPVIVKPKSGPPIGCHFDVHLMVPHDLERVEQAVLRRDLLIGEEPIGGGSLRQRARGLTLIDHPELSKLLLSAEEPTHLRWNSRLPRLGEYYKSGRDVIAYVRNAMAKLLEILAGGEQKRDYRLLAKYFSAPGTNDHAQAKGKKSEKGKGPVVVNDIPPPTPKKMVLTPMEYGCKVSSSTAFPFMQEDLPVAAQIEFAYEGLDKDAFAEYDLLDFDLSDAAFSISTSNCEVTSRMLNRVEFNITAPDFELRLVGFDHHLRLRVRLKYMEARDAALVDT